MSLFNILQYLYVGGTVLGSSTQSTTQYTNMPLSKKIMLGSSLIIGIDSLIAPYFTGGQSLHEQIGISFGGAETLINSFEIIGAYIGTTYQNIQAIKHLKRSKKEQ